MDDPPPGMGYYRFELVTTLKDGRAIIADYGPKDSSVATADWVTATKNPNTATSMLYWHGRGRLQQWPRNNDTMSEE